MVLIIILLVVALAGSIYLYSAQRRGLAAKPGRQEKYIPNTERIADAVHSAASGKMREASGTLQEDDDSRRTISPVKPIKHPLDGFDGFLAGELRCDCISTIFPFKEEWQGWLYIPEKVRKVTMDDIIFHLLNMSQLPSINIPALYELNRVDSSVADVTKAVESDWNLAARIIKLANSAFYGLGEEVADIHRAIILLGFDTVRSLIYMSAIYEGLERVKGPITSKATFLHCLAASCATPYFAQNLTQQGRSLVATTALFHDVGKVLCSQISKVKTEAALDGMKGNISFDCAQLDAFGMSHYLMTAILLDLWHFPPKLTSLLLESAPDAQARSEEARVLHNAGLFAAKLGFDACGTESGSNELAFKLNPDEEKAAAEEILSRLDVFKPIG